MKYFYALSAIVLALSACNTAQPRSEVDPKSQVLASSSLTCYNFDNQIVGTVYRVGSSYLGNKAQINFQPYLFNGATFYATSARITNSGIVNNTPPSVGFHSITADFVPDSPAQQVRFLYSEVLQGVHANFQVNGSGILEYGSLFDLHGQTIGGVLVEVTQTLLGGKQIGSVTLTALSQPIASFSLGGRTLTIDDFCHR